MYKTSMLLISILFAATMILSPILLSTSTFGQAKPRLPDNSVVSSTIVDGQVTSDDIANQGVQDKDLSPNSIASFNIIDKQVTSTDIAGSAVTTEQIRDGTILEEDIRPGEIIGEPGPAGPAGPQGEQGPPGPAQSISIVPASSERLNFDPDNLVGGLKPTAICPPNMVAISGGYDVSPHVRIISESIATDLGPGRTGWRVSAVNDSPEEPGHVMAIANCVPLPPPQ